MKTHLPTLAWALLTGGLLLTPGSRLEPFNVVAELGSAAEHLLLFFGLGLLLARSLRAAAYARPLAAALVASLAYGWVLEIAQIAVEGRAFEWWDLVLDGLGALAGVALARRLGARSRS